MYFKQFLNDSYGCASYLIASRETGETAVVDPAITIDQYADVLAARSLRLRHVIDTHIHADHLSGARTLASAHGASLYLHADARVTYPFQPLHDGAELALGQLRLRVLHTPGHRPELISLLVSDLSRSPEPSLVLTGDCLLSGDVGRPDFGGGDAQAQYESVRRLLALPDWVAVFPGHFEGPCGRAMDGRPSTTIGFDRRYSPLLSLGRDAFVSRLSADIPPRPLNMTSIEAINRGNADQAEVMVTDNAIPVPEVSIDELAVRDGAVVVDVREPDEYRRGHIPGAWNVPQAELASRLDDLPPDRPLMFVCESGRRSLQAARFASQMGLAPVANVAGGTAAWRVAARPLTMEGAEPA